MSQMTTNPKGQWVHSQLFQQKGWIANNFKVKNSMNAVLKWKRRNFTQSFGEQYQPKNGHCNRSVSLQQVTKPSTAGQSQTRKQFYESFEQMGPIKSQWNESSTLLDTNHSNFKTTIGNRKQLLFIKPYMRYRNQSMTPNQKKSQIYKQINNPDLNTYNDVFKKIGVIEYMTEYKEPFSSRECKKDEDKKQIKHRMSMNILKQKLKRKNQPSTYQRRIHSMKLD